MHVCPRKRFLLLTLPTQQRKYGDEERLAAVTTLFTGAFLAHLENPRASLAQFVFSKRAVSGSATHPVVPIPPVRTRPLVARDPKAALSSPKAMKTKPGPTPVHAPVRDLRRPTAARFVGGQDPTRRKTTYGTSRSPHSSVHTTGAFLTVAGCGSPSSSKSMTPLPCPSSSNDEDEDDEDSSLEDDEDTEWGINPSSVEMCVDPEWWRTFWEWVAAAKRRGVSQTVLADLHRIGRSPTVYDADAFCSAHADLVAAFLAGQPALTTFPVYSL